MEMQLFLRERLKHTDYFHKSDDGDWHLCRFVEELKNDGKEQVVCTKCDESAVVGPTLKCTACPYLRHLSCFERSTIYFHFGRRHDNDQLMFTEELRSDDDGKEEGVVCMACDEQVEGPGYKCSTSECNFRLHKSCAQLPRQIQCHPSHPKHVLFLRLPAVRSSTCNACGKWCRTCLHYRCGECDFNLDLTCATRTQININIDDCQHAFVTSFKQIHFTCEACGQEGTDFASLCTICQLFVHSRCAGFPRTIIVSGHHHPLTLIYSLHRQAKDFNDIFCNLCRKKVKMEYAAFCCLECDFVVHLYCADAYRYNILEPVLLPENSVDVMEKINPGEIRHFSHPHDLILSHEELFNDKMCDGCMNFIISAPFYTCTQCLFFLHATCARLPKKKNHILHYHMLALHSNAPYTGEVYRCDACGHSRHGFTYRCDKCEFDLDVQCCLVPEILKHEGHQHSLFLPISSNKSCNACDHNHTNYKDTKVFICTTCDFTLGFECATLPLVVRHKYDEHPLALTYVAENNSGEYYCLICEEKRDSNHWFYYCEKCDFPAHVQCVLGKYPYIKFGRSYKNEEHQHPLTCVRKTKDFPPCDACGNTFDGMAIECTQCKFNVHLNSKCMSKVGC